MLVLFTDEDDGSGSLGVERRRKISDDFLDCVDYVGIGEDLFVAEGVDKVSREVTN